MFSLCSKRKDVWSLALIVLFTLGLVLLGCSGGEASAPEDAADAADGSDQIHFDLCGIGDMLCVPEAITPACDADCAEPFKDEVTDAEAEEDGEDDGEPPLCVANYEGCNSNKECCTGWCLPNADGYTVCTEECIEECPAGWECKGVNFGGDIIFLCHAVEDLLCSKECQTDFDCGAGEHFCMEVGADKFCLQDCSADGECPEYYSCKQVENEEGVTGEQCWPDSESCICDASVDYMTNAEHCAYCGNACAYDNGVGECVGGVCGLGDCLEGYFDLNGLEVDGCEYFCEKTSEVDLPDPEGIDANCDGIDGEWPLAVLVDGESPESFDEGNVWGDVTSPFRTVGAAMNFAADEGKPHVYVSRGSYYEQIRIQSGISLYGGYNADLAWGRNLDTNKTIFQWDGVTDGQVIGVLALSINEKTTFDGFSLLTGSSPAKGGSSFGMYLFHTSQHFIVSNNRIVPGNGGGGQDGAQGSDGLAGENGENGNMGCEYDGCLLCSCSSCSQPPAGGGGQAYCSNHGGAGGLGGEHEENGKLGESAPGGAKGGGYGAESQNGQKGDNGAPGVAGQDGRGGFGNGFIDDSGFWRAYDGEDGTDGTKGWGGGGGGGGGGDEGSFLGIACYTYGGSGGGGGGGGCPGTAGKAGTGGGGSFAIFIVDGDATITNNEINYRSGGKGGVGGKAGIAGKGGKVGKGGIGDQDDNEGSGGDGGAGGDGGRGGHGGGGAGGSTFGIFMVGLSNPICGDNLFIQDGFPGEGGQGGDGSPTTEGANGAAGKINSGSADCNEGQ